jgi:DnaJ-class molecular chaperone
LPRTNNDQRGNLLLKVQIAIAQNLSEDQKNLLRQFQNG